MKQKGLIFSCMMVFCLVVGVFSAGAAYNISLEATTDGSTVYEEFSPGDTLYLNISLDAGSGGVAACAFTLEYPADKLTPPTTDANGVSADITSIFPFQTTVEGTASDTHRENSSVAGKIYFAGAEITTKGGSKIHPYDVTLFTAKFTVKDAASGSIVFTLKQTELLNEAAGWGVGGVAEAVPIIVGAMPNDATQATFTPWVDGFGGTDLSDDFPVRLASFAINPTLTVTAGPVSDYDTWKIENGYNNPDIGGPEADYDNDGFTNDQERLTPSDPKEATLNPVASGVDVTNPATWAVMGAGYNAIRDFRVSNLDIDGNGKAELTTDAALLYRYMQNKAWEDFGIVMFDDAALVDGATAGDCKRCDATSINAYIDAVDEAAYDVDDSGKPSLTTDATLIYRYIQNKAWEPFGIVMFDDDALIDGAVDSYAGRQTAAEIKAYIDLIFPD